MKMSRVIMPITKGEGMVQMAFIVFILFMNDSKNSIQFLEALGLRF